MNAKRPSFVACAVRALSPTTMIAIAAVTFLVVSVLEQADVAHRARDINRQLEVVRAQIAAETALIEQVAAGDKGGQLQVAGVHVGVAWQRDLCTVYVTGASGETVLASRQLPGGAPSVFSHARAATDAATLAEIGGKLCEAPDNWPELDLPAIASAPRVTESLGFRRDPEIALRHLASGSDRPDYVWSSNRVDLAKYQSGGLLIVPGNLWLEDREHALTLNLAKDLVVIIEGNLHLLRSLHVRGRGRLLLATDTADAGVVFADIDGSGGWTTGDRLHRGAAFAGQVEGSGNVYLGLPGAGGTLACDAGILVGGELHVAVRADVRGPLLLRFGCTFLSGEHLEAPALTAPLTAPLAAAASRLPGRSARRRQWVFGAGRDPVPGFLVTGKPRPSRLEFRSR